MNQVKGQIERIARLEIRLAQLNTSAEQTRAHLVDQVQSLNERYDDLARNVERVDLDFRERIDAIEGRLEILENPEDPPNYATKAELAEVLTRTRAMFEGRLQEIELQIGQVCENISELTLSGGKPAKRPGQPASEILSRLVQDQKP
jgi:multidrug resistance efflux pump